MPTSAAATVSAQRPFPAHTAGGILGPAGVHLATEACDDVLVACPDARSPAYQAVVGLARAAGCADS